jgi:hypothetical protein
VQPLTKPPVPPVAGLVLPAAGADELPAVGVTFELSPGGDELAEEDAVVESDAVALADAVVVGVAFVLGFLLVAGVGVGQLVASAPRAEVLPLAGLDAAAAVVVVVVAEAVALLVAVALPVGLTLPLGLTVALPLPEAGLVGELGGGVDGLVGGLDGLDALVAGVGEADADGCAQDETGAGDGRCAAVVPAPRAPPRTLPPLLAAAELAALLELVPSSTLDTDELSAVRSVGTEANTTPTANTAQASAMAGLISASRQSLTVRSLAGRSLAGREARRA